MSYSQRVRQCRLCGIFLWLWNTPNKKVNFSKYLLISPSNVIILRTVAMMMICWVMPIRAASCSRNESIFVQAFLPPWHNTCTWEQSAWWWGWWWWCWWWWQRLWWCGWTEIHWIIFHYTLVCFCHSPYSVAWPWWYLLHSGSINPRDGQSRNVASIAIIKDCWYKCYGWKILIVASSKNIGQNLCKLTFQEED